MSLSDKENFMLSLSRQREAENTKDKQRERGKVIFTGTRATRFALLSAQGADDDDGVVSKANKHGFFDDEFFDEMAEADRRRELAKANQLNSNHEQNISLPHNIHQDELAESSSSMRINQHKESSPTTGEEILDTVKDSLNSIDEQYFGEAIQNTIPQTFSRQAVSTSPQPTPSKVTENDLGVIDEHYFSSIFDETSEQSDQSLPSHINSVVSKQEQSAAAYFEDLSSDDLNYFDQIMTGVEQNDFKGNSAKADTAKQNKATLIDGKIQTSGNQLFEEKQTGLRKFAQSKRSSATDAQQLQHKSSNDVTEVSVDTDNLPEPVEPASPAPEQRVRRTGQKVLHALVTDLNKEPSYSIIDMLLEKKVYEDDKLVCFNKPYGLASQDGAGLYHSITKYLPEIAARLKCDQPLYLCHRLDQECTGVTIVAKGEDWATKIKKRFEVGDLVKKYTTITVGVPNPLQGCVDIPIATSTLVNGKYRSVLVPTDTKTQRKGVYLAKTEYEVAKRCETAALLDITPLNGRKHQIRVHLADGLNTPILGDHKYSHRERLAPQRLPGDILEKFYLEKSKSRHMPMHLHAAKLVFPNYFINGRELHLTAPLPKFFSRSIKILKFWKKWSR